MGLPHARLEGLLFSFLKCPFTNGKALGNKGKTYSTTCTYNATVQRRTDGRDWLNSNNYTKRSDLILGLEGIYLSVLKEMTNMIVRLWFVSKKNG